MSVAQPKNKSKLRFRLISSIAVLGVVACFATSCAPQFPVQQAAFPQANLRPTQIGTFNANPAAQPATTPLQLFRRIAPQQYYQRAQGLQGKNLLIALNQIVAKHKDLGYSRGRDIMFGEVDDLDNDNVVEGVYSGRRLPRVTNRTNAYQNGAGLNAEHTWPKSKGAKSGPAKSDLHHLFPSDIKTNSVRSSYPFGHVANVKYQKGGSKFGTDSQGRRVFEPRNQHKGNLARALLYFYTVYGVRGRISLQNFKQEESVLKRWHQIDPVDAAERARNEAVFKYQGNRNPYIDHPEYVERIGRFQP